jgi:hypothetical protein
MASTDVILIRNWRAVNHRLTIGQTTCDNPGTMSESPSPKPKPGMPQWMTLMGLGFELVMTIVIFGAIGYGIDHWRQWTPVATITGVVLGCLIGMSNMIRSALRSLE